MVELGTDWARGGAGAVTREGDEREAVGRGKRLPQPSRDLLTRHVRHREIQERDSRVLPLDELDGLFSLIGNFHVLTEALEDLGERIGNVGLVVDDQDSKALERARRSRAVRGVSRPKISGRPLSRSGARCTMTTLAAPRSAGML